MTKQRLNITCDPNLIARVKPILEANGQKFSSVVAVLLEDYISELEDTRTNDSTD